MGIKANGATVMLFNIDKSREKAVRARIYMSHKDRETDEWIVDLSSYAWFFGDAADVVRELNEKDKVKIEEFDISNRYDPEEKKEWWSIKIYKCKHIKRKPFVPKYVPEDDFI